MRPQTDSNPGPAGSLWLGPISSVEATTPGSIHCKSELRVWGSGEVLIHALLGLPRIQFSMRNGWNFS